MTEFYLYGGGMCDVVTDENILKSFLMSGRGVNAVRLSDRVWDRVEGDGEESLWGE